MMNNEVWKTIIGYEGSYEVSNFGRVKSLPRFVANSGHRGVKYPERILSQKTDKDGYAVVKLSSNGKLLDRKVHRLVRASFDGICANNNLQVNHINGIKDDNRLENLEWSTSSENQLHRANTLKTGRIVGCEARLSCGKVVSAHSITALAEKLGVSRGTIYDRLRKNKPLQNGTYFKRIVDK